MSQQQTTSILHVEDNRDDVILVELAFRKAGVGAKLEVAMDGEQAIQKLQQGFSTSPPACVLLDLKLPTISGLQVLQWVRTQPRFRRLPVVMLTSSLLPNDINQAYDFGANSYLIKPPDLDSLVSLARMIDLYWLRTNIRPADPG